MRKRRIKKNSIQTDIFLFILALILTLIVILLLIKNSLIKNIFNEKAEDYISIDYNQIKKNILVESKIDKNEEEFIVNILNEDFIIKPPEIQKIKEELKIQQIETFMNKKEVNLYFIKVTSEGHFLKQPTKRTIYYEQNILEETLKALIKGPNQHELKNNFLSLIPVTTKILSLSINENVAKINLSKDFYDNAFGIEGTVNKVKQIVLTSLSINKIKSIIIRIEGNPIIIEELGLDFSEALNKRNISNY